MRDINLSRVHWRKSSYSNPDGGNCLEVADHIPALVPVRDSKAPTHGTLTFTHTTWTAFTTSIKQGR